MGLGEEGEDGGREREWLVFWGGGRRRMRSLVG